jgi:hypothetical protein
MTIAAGRGLNLKELVNSDVASLVDGGGVDVGDKAGVGGRSAGADDEVGWGASERGGGEDEEGGQFRILRCERTVRRGGRARLGQETYLEWFLPTWS